ncbi:MAG: CaiB/BaiF CoA transferase family protein [Nitrososphaerales archaeon]
MRPHISMHARQINYMGEGRYALEYMSEQKEQEGPLSGVKVLDLSRVMAGPYATMLLADYGADVIKIEEPEKGDETRYWYPPTIEGESAYYLSANRNKRSLTLNMKSKEGLEIFYKLVKDSDVLIQNFRPSVTQRLGIDYDSVSKVNPKIVYCSISGFGQTGPYRDLPGYDLIVFAMGGIMSFTGEDGRPPMRVSVPLADLGAGLWSVTAILAALRYRDLKGTGQHIDVSMHDVQVSFLTHQAMNYFATGKDPKKTGSMHANLAPYQAFKASDAYFVLAVGNDKLWTDFCREIGHEEWSSDPRFKTNPDRMNHKPELISLLDELFAKESAKHWLEAARKAGVPAGPILQISEVVSNPHVLARGMVTEVDNPRTGKKLKQLGTPVKFSKAKTSIRMAPPGLGEHSEEVLKELGYSEKEIERLKTHRIV